MKHYIYILLIFISVNAFSQTERKFIRAGNKQYNNSNYTEADISYRKAIDKKPNSLEAGFNIGNTLYKQGKFEESGKQFQALTESTKDKELLSKIYYNLGNSYFKSNKLQESANAYKNALRNNPKDADAKYNLSLVQKMMKQQNQNNKDNKNDQNKDQQNKQDQNKQDQNKQDQNKDNKQDQNKQDQQKQDQQNQQGNQGQDNKPKEQPGQISAGDAQRILDALKDDEKAVQMRMQQLKAKEEKEKKAAEKMNNTKNW